MAWGLGSLRHVDGTLGTVLAHQGGWDEILLVLAPLAIFALLLRAARKRVEQLEDERDAATGDAGKPRDLDRA